jgi:hypothetical protein
MVAERAGLQRTFFLFTLAALLASGAFAAAEPTLKTLTAADFKSGTMILPVEQSFLAEVQKGEAPLRFRFTIEPDPDQKPGATPAGWLAIFRNERLLQRISVPVVSRGELVNTALTLRDVNFDGSLDLLVARQPGQSSTRYAAYLFNPANDQFERDELTVELDKLPGLAQPDATTHRILVESQATACRAKLLQVSRLEGAALVLIRTDSAALQGTACVVTTQQLVDGTMQVTSTQPAVP